MNDDIKIKNPHVLVQLLIALLILPIDGWIIKLMWDWFIVPLGITPITVWHAVGLDIIFSYLMASISRREVDGGFWVRMFSTLFLSLFFLFFAFIVHLFM